MLEVTFIGTSGSAPTTERGMPALSIKYESALMLFDCGEGTQRQMMKYKTGFGSINAIFITHAHLDHYLGLFGLLETLRMGAPSPKKLQIFIPSNMDDSFAQRYPFVELKKIRKGKIFEGRGFSVSAVPVEHIRNSFAFVFQEAPRRKFDEKKAKGMGILGKMFSEIERSGSITIKGKKIRLEEVSWEKPGRKIVYSGDTSFCRELIDAAKGADLLIHEGTFDASKADEAKERQHSTVDDAAKAAKAAGVSRLIITHISPRYSDETKALADAAAKVFRNSSIAEDGMKVVL